MMTLRQRLALAAVAALSVAVPPRHGVMAFHYARNVTPAQLEWLSHFDVVVTHDPLPAAQVAALHERGTRLVLYEWAVAFYASRATPFDARLLASHHALLNRQPLRGGLGANDSDAYYFDPASTIHAAERPKAIAARLREIGYDGVFLDTTTAESVHRDALAAYRAQHPDVPYDRAFASFMHNLRVALRGGIVVTNQGYRDADDYLPFVDYDVTESLITHPVAGAFRVRPWNDPHDPWNSIEFLMAKLIDPAKRKYPRVRFVHLNYVDRLDAEEAKVIPQVAKRLHDAAFVALPSVVGTP
jgi:hypothetical protein